MKKTKLEKGITLVALIITIVVLLILAVVSIGAVKNSGIIGHATNTADMWTTAQTAENASLLKYENYLDKYENKIYEKEKEWKVYGTLESYVIMSSDGDIIMRDSEGITKAKLQKYSKEQYIQIAIQEDSTANADDIRKEIEMVLSQWEDAEGVKFEYLMADINGDFEGALIFSGERCYIGDHEYLEPNEELAKQVIRKKGTFECYGLANIEQEEKEESSGGINISVSITDWFYIVDDECFIGCLGTPAAAAITRIGMVSINEEEFNVLKDVNGDGETIENYVIKVGAKKLSQKVKSDESEDSDNDDADEEPNDTGAWYIQDGAIWCDKDVNAVIKGERAYPLFPKLSEDDVDQIDFEKFGIVVIE